MVVTIALLAMIALTTIISIVLLTGIKQNINEKLQAEANLQETIKSSRDDTIASVNQSVEIFASSIRNEQKEFRENTLDSIDRISRNVGNISDSNEKRLDAMRVTIADGIRDIRTENSERLKEMQAVVDEKLQETLEKRITESFKTVSDQLEQVHRGLGEMTTLAGDVGGLKKILSGVKTRGILGEIQLKGILEDILTPSQYEENFVTAPGSRERVEFAVKLPGPEDGSPVYLPIDSKFPGDTYARLQDAQENGDKENIKAAYKALEQRLREEARDIHDKYIYPPYTTNFGIMFLPFEGLYAEAIRLSGRWQSRNSRMKCGECSTK